MPFLNPVDRMQAAVLGIGLGIAALPKTVIQLSRPSGFGEVMMWLEVSNNDVSNSPDVHKH